MNRLREFIGSSSGLAPIRLGLSVLAGLAVLIEINKAEADPVCLTPTCLIGINKAEANRLCPTPTPTCIPCPNTWIQCFDCSANSEHPICARADTDPVEPEAKYLYCIYALDADCSFYIKNCWYSSTPCSEAVPEWVLTAATSQDTGCWYSDECAEFNSTEPYRHCTTYHFNDDMWWRSCLCSSTLCSEVKQAMPTAVLTPSAGQPVQHRLGTAYPNPFNPAIVIPLDLATDEERVHLALYNVLGHRVRQLWHGPLRAGSHRFVWDGRDEKGKAVAAGVYIYKVEVDGQVEAKKTTKLP